METVNTGYVGFPTVEIFFVMVKNIAVLKYYRINSEEDGREACAILHAAGPSKVCTLRLQPLFSTHCIH